MDSFIFLRSYYDAAKYLEEDDRASFLAAICGYVFEEKNPLEVLENHTKGFWILIKPSLDKSLASYKSKIDNGKKGGRPKKTESIDSEGIRSDLKTELKPKRNRIKTEKKAKQNLNNTNTNNNTNINSNYNSNINTKKEPSLTDFKTYALDQARKQNISIDTSKLILKYEAWKADGWKDGNGKTINNWKSKILHSLVYWKTEEGSSKPASKAQQLIDLENPYKDDNHG